MRGLTALWIVLLLGYAAAADQQTELMDEVEAKVQLPPGASPLDQYVRYYSYLGDGTIIGIYVADSLEETLKHATHPARQWVKPGELPVIAGGGCSVVTVFYDPKKGQTPDARCNFKE